MKGNAPGVHRVARRARDRGGRHAKGSQRRQRARALAEGSHGSGGRDNYANVRRCALCPSAAAVPLRAKARDTPPSPRRPHLRCSARPTAAPWSPAARCGTMRACSPLQQARLSSSRLVPTSHAPSRVEPRTRVDRLRLHAASHGLVARRVRTGDCGARKTQAPKPVAATQPGTTGSAGAMRRRDRAHSGVELDTPRADAAARPPRACALGAPPAGAAASLRCAARSRRGPRERGRRRA